MKNFILLCILICFTFSCKTEKKVKESKFSDLPALPQDQLQKLFNEVTYIDYIFYDLPFSISQDDKPSINSNLQLLSPNKIDGLALSCKPIGREFFHINGNITYEADIYFQDGCYGYIFLKKETPIYANKVSESGMKFYSNIINQAEQIKNQAINGG
jgi:hypothetical protein